MKKGIFAFMSMLIVVVLAACGGSSSSGGMVILIDYIRKEALTNIKRTADFTASLQIISLAKYEIRCY